MLARPVCLADDTVNKPLLSLCIPTFNAGLYVDVVLGALLPQSRELGSMVEVIVVDDASPEPISASVLEAERNGDLRFIQNPTNVGMANNIANAICVHAKGEFVWVLSQHNLLSPGALRSVVETISRNTGYDAFYVNFRCATYPDQWPTDANGGYSGPFAYLSSADTSDRKLSAWEAVIDPNTGSGTQTYSHIARRSLLVRVLEGRRLGREYATALDTYTQTAAVATVMFGRPAFYIGEPCLTMFNGAQTWSSVHSRARVYLSGYPDLIRLYRRLGWNALRVAEAQRWGNQRAGSVVTQILRENLREERHLIRRYVFNNWRSPGVVSTTWRAYLSSESSAATVAYAKLKRATQSARNYFLYNWRPARWLRNSNR